MPKEWTQLSESSEIYFVIGSGFSLDNYPDGFLDSLMSHGVVVGVNDVALDVPCHYVVRKCFLNDEGKMPEKMPEYKFANNDCKLVISQFDSGNKERPLNTDIKGDYYFFKHRQTMSMWGMNFPDLESDEILVSWTTSSSAIHFAAKMGARLIVLIGQDLTSGNYSKYSTLGTRYFTGYWSFRGQAIKTQRFIEENYEIAVCSLSPFMGTGYADNKWPRRNDSIIKSLVILRNFPRIVSNKLSSLFGRDKKKD